MTHESYFWKVLSVLGQSRDFGVGLECVVGISHSESLSEAMMS